MGYLLAEFGMTAESVSVYRSLLDRGILRAATIDEILVGNLIDALNRVDQHTNAIELFENSLPSISVTGPMGHIYFNAGNSYLKAERFQDAISCYRTSLKTTTANPCQALHNLGNCYFGLRDYGNALKYYTLALPEATTDGDKGIEEYAIGSALSELGRYDEAEAYFGRAAERGHEYARLRIDDMS